MDNLPPELLSTIFLHTLPAANFSVKDDIRRVDPSSLHIKISSVCRRWNEIAIATPEMWTFIIFSASSSCHTVMERRLRLSKMALLDILLDVGDWDRDEPSLWKDRSFWTVQNAAQRCRSFQIRGKMSRAPRELPGFGGWRILPSRRSNGPNDMETTALELPSSAKLTIERQGFLKLIKNGDSIRHLNLDHSRYDWGQIFASVPLSRFHNLEVLEVRGPWIVPPIVFSLYGTQQAQRPSFQLPNLKTIIFFAIRSNVIQFLIPRLDAVVLNTVIFHNCGVLFPASTSDVLQIPELKLSNGRVIPVVRILSPWAKGVESLVRNIPNYAQHKLEFCLLSPSRSEKDRKSWRWLEQNVPNAQLVRRKHRDEYECPAYSEPGLPSWDMILSEHKSREEIRSSFNRYCGIET